MKKILSQLGNVLTALLTLIFTIVAFSLYGANVGGEGYFNGATVDSVVTVSSLVIVFEVIILAYSIVATIFKMKDKTFLPELATKIIDTVLDVIKVIIPAILALALFEFIDTRVEGLAFIYFSNPDVLVTIQTPANLASASSAIMGFIMYAISIFVGVVAAYFSVTKKDKAQVAATAQA